MRQFSGNEAGTGGLVTFKDSNWLMSVVLAHQPHFANQPADVQVFWGYALFPDRIGNFVAKPMAECNGAEILGSSAATCASIRRLRIGQLHSLPDALHHQHVHAARSGDRPPPVPARREEPRVHQPVRRDPDDVVFTVEYSVRAAQMAVYELLGVDRKVPPVTPHDKSLSVEFEALIKAFK